MRKVVSMGFKIGEVDLYTRLLNNEYQTQRLFGAINLLMDKVKADFTDEELKQIDQEALDFLKQQYPNEDIKTQKEVQNDT